VTSLHARTQNTNKNEIGKHSSIRNKFIFQCKHCTSTAVEDDESKKLRCSQPCFVRKKPLLWHDDDDDEHGMMNR